MWNKVLKPCPFCGSSKLKVDKNTRNVRIIYSVRCNSCHARGGASGFEKFMPESDAFVKRMNEHINLAIEKWNVRAGEK